MKWKFSPRVTLWIFVGICLVMIGSTALIALGYLEAPARREVFEQTVYGTVLRVEEDGRALRVTDLVWDDPATQDQLGMKQLYAQLQSTSELTDQWGTEIQAADIAEGSAVKLVIAETKFRDEERTIASAKVYSLLLDPQ